MSTGWSRNERTAPHKPAVRENLSEEELAIFDLLTTPEPKLTMAQEVEVMAIARQLLEKLHELIEAVDWVSGSGDAGSRVDGDQAALQRSTRGTLPAGPLGCQCQAGLELRAEAVCWWCSRERENSIVGWVRCCGPVTALRTFRTRQQSGHSPCEP